MSFQAPLPDDFVNLLDVLKEDTAQNPDDLV